MIKKLAQVITLPVLILLAACGGDDTKKIDDALKNDLSLASQAYPYQPFVSPIEQGYAAGGYSPAVARYPTPVANRRAGGTVYRTSSTGTARQPTRVVKNTKRDAIIGAAAGAAIGAVTSRDKLKGAIIGGAAGGILGAVIGNNVDKKKVPY